MRYFLTAFVLAALWLLMSGIFEPLIMAFGLASVVFVLFVIARMDAEDDDRVALSLDPVRFAGYFLWLLKEIALANWAVTKVVLSRGLPIRQHLFTTPATQKTDLGQVIFANSITLTPGTITVETETGQFIVHALDYSADDNLALMDMNDRVAATERGAQ